MEAGGALRWLVVMSVAFSLFLGLLFTYFVARCCGCTSIFNRTAKGLYTIGWYAGVFFLCLYGTLWMFDRGAKAYLYATEFRGASYLLRNVTWPLPAGSKQPLSARQSKPIVRSSAPLEEQDIIKEKPRAAAAADASSFIVAPATTEAAAAAATTSLEKQQLQPHASGIQKKKPQQKQKTKT